MPSGSFRESHLSDICCNKPPLVVLVIANSQSQGKDDITRQQLCSTGSTSRRRIRSGGKYANVWMGKVHATTMSWCGADNDLLCRQRESTTLLGMTRCPGESRTFVSNGGRVHKLLIESLHPLSRLFHRVYAAIALERLPEHARALSSL